MDAGILALPIDIGNGNVVDFVLAVSLIGGPSISDL